MNARITMAKHESQQTPGLFYWAEYFQTRRGVGPIVWMVVSQMSGTDAAGNDWPATEACDDWFADMETANEIAWRLACGEAVEDGTMSADTLELTSETGMAACTELRCGGARLSRNHK